MRWRSGRLNSFTPRWIWDPARLANLLRLNPQWPLADACVEIPGYDVPALPESGVVNAALYWSIVAQADNAPK